MLSPITAGNLTAAGDVAGGNAYSSILGALTSPKTVNAVSGLFNQNTPAGDTTYLNAPDSDKQLFFGGD